MEVRENDLTSDQAAAIAALSLGDLLGRRGVCGRSRADFRVLTAERAALFSKLGCPASIRGGKKKPVE